MHPRRCTTRPGCRRGSREGANSRAGATNAPSGCTTRHATFGRSRRAVRGELTRSDLEAVFLALCDAQSIPRPLVNHVVEDKEVDFFWPEQRLIVETDGRATHFTRAAFERDRARDAHLLALGYRTMRVSDLQVRRDGATVAARLKALLPTSASR